MELTDITVYQNTPYTDFNNMVNFGDNAKRDKFFDNHYTQHHFKNKFDFIRDRLTLRVPASECSFAFMSQVNYVRFKSAFDDITYYAMIPETKYLNNGTIECHLVIDGLMTFCQGDISKYAQNVQIERQHLSKQAFEDNLKYLRTNQDTIAVNTLSFVHQDQLLFSAMKVIFRSSADLESDFGDVNDPKFNTSDGVIYDEIVSPQNLYLTDYGNFNSFMKKTQKFPWITQNITSVQIIPSMFIDESDLVDCKPKSFEFDGLKKFKTKSKSKNIGVVDNLSKDWPQLLNTFGIGYLHPEIARQGYANIMMTNWQGSQVDIDVSQLPDNGLEIYGILNTGYDTNAYFFPRSYASSKLENTIDEGHSYKGSFLNNAVAFTNWDEVPILTDNYRLSLANGAHQRALAQNNLITGQASNVVDSNQPLQDRLMSAVNLSSSVSVGAISGKLVDEWQFYRKQQAEFADKKISAPSISEMSNNNSLARKQGYFGITVKYSAVDKYSIQAIINYHSQFGYDWQRVGDLQPVDTMKYINYAKFKGNWQIYDRQVPQSIMEQIRVQFENGVKIWHNPDNLDYPYNQSEAVSQNERIK